MNGKLAPPSLQEQGLINTFAAVRFHHFENVEQHDDGNR